MSSINPLRFGVPGNNYIKRETPNHSKQSSEQDDKNTSKKENNINSNSVFDYMAAQNADIMPASITKTYNVSKYVSAEQETRIQDFMKGFETDFDEIANAASNEFPELTEGAVSELALTYINNKYEE